MRPCITFSTTPRTPAPYKTGLGILTGLLVFVCSAQAEDWNTWLGPRRDCSSSEKFEPWKGNPKVEWKIPVGEGHSSPVVANGRVYLHTRVKGKEAEELAAYDAATGKTAWTTSYPRGPFQSVFGFGPRGTPTVANGKIFTFGVTGILSCFNEADGKILWQHDTLTQFNAANLFFGASCSPLLYKDKVIVQVGGQGASLVAFNTGDGAVAWKSLNDKATYSSPILCDLMGATSLFALTQQGLVCLDPETGKQFWKYPLVDRLNESSTTPILLGETILASSVTFGSVGIKLDEGRQYIQSWKNGSLTCYFATPVPVGKDHVYMVTGGLLPPPESHLHCVDIKTGKILWTKKKVGQYHASLIKGANNRLLMLEDTGHLTLIEPDGKEYKELSRSKVCAHTWAHPAAANARIFLRDDKDLLCVNLGQ